ncbi:hypothetical protein C0Q70_21043 [Pomacea canaliculata]|uniref:Uncharacterized protein n=1 Tax=Pomacea canaliculata TaxID=400727 RepID=A0A2T7NBE5_POMCA|nr:hypothetical protein C0Q70_21043 [Pomacea canaliculata]
MKFPNCTCPQRPLRSGYPSFAHLLSFCCHASVLAPDHVTGRGKARLRREMARCQMGRMPSREPSCLPPSLSPPRSAHSDIADSLQSCDFRTFGGVDTIPRQSRKGDYFPRGELSTSSSDPQNGLEVANFGLLPRGVSPHFCSQPRVLDIYGASSFHPSTHPPQHLQTEQDITCNFAPVICDDTSLSSQ